MGLMWSNNTALHTGGVERGINGSRTCCTEDKYKQSRGEVRR